MGELELSSFMEARMERSAYVACAFLVFYEYCLQLDCEVEFFWKQPWSPAKALFLWSRYYSLAYNIGNAIVFLRTKPSYNFCVHYFIVANVGAVLQVITSHLALQLRLWAMYGGTRLILIVFAVLLTLETLIASMIVIYGIFSSKLIATNEPFPGNFICADAEPVDGSHWVIYFWVTSLSVEGLLFLMALYKAWQNRAAGHGGTFMRHLTKGSVLYFLFIFWFYCVNIVFWYRNRITLNEFAPPFGYAIPSVLANRLLISVRIDYYKSVSDVETYMPSLYDICYKRHRRARTCTTTSCILDTVRPESFPS